MMRSAACAAGLMSTFLCSTPPPNLLPQAAALRASSPPLFYKARAAAAPRCCERPEPLLFDAALEGLLADAEAAGSIDAALDNGWLDKLDDAFIPSLGNLINSATPEELPKLEELDKKVRETWHAMLAERQRIDPLKAIGGARRQVASVAGRTLTRQRKRYSV